MRKIAIVGPESSGKSTLAQELMLHARAWLIAEVARDYLSELGRPYEEKDLLAIAMAQAANEDMIAEEGAHEDLMICDTDMITLRIWSEEKYGRCDPWIIEQSGKRHYDLWLLCSPDIPWEFDPLRENPHDRERLFEVYRAVFKALRKPCVIISGDRNKRLKDAMAAIELLPDP